MRTVLEQRHHFDRDSAEDIRIRRALNENISIIGVWDGTDSELKAFAALNHGFTDEQLILVNLKTRKEAAAKLRRHVRQTTEYSKAVVLQTRQALSRFVDAVDNLRTAIKNGEVSYVTGIKQEK